MDQLRLRAQGARDASVRILGRRTGLAPGIVPRDLDERQRARAGLELPSRAVRVDVEVPPWIVQETDLLTGVGAGAVEEIGRQRRGRYVGDHDGAEISVRRQQLGQPDAEDLNLVSLGN